MNYNSDGGCVATGEDFVEAGAEEVFKDRKEFKDEDFIKKNTDMSETWAFEH